MKEVKVSTSLLYHTQCIRDYQYESSEYGNCEVIWNIRRKSFCCNKCGYPGVSIVVARERLIKGERIGNKHFFLRVPIHRIYCSECKNITIENLSFLSSSKARITKSLERTIYWITSEDEHNRCYILFWYWLENSKRVREKSLDIYH